VPSARWRAWPQAEPDTKLSLPRPAALLVGGWAQEAREGWDGIKEDKGLYRVPTLGTPLIVDV
jgi:hypothetical protein